MMTRRSIACLAFSLAALAPGLALAQEVGELTEVNRLQLELSVINAEIKSELEQVLILQEAIKANARLSLKEQGRSPDPVSFSDMTMAQRQAIQREIELNDRIKAILARSAAHDARKLRLLERLRVLTGIQ